MLLSQVGAIDLNRPGAGSAALWKWAVRVNHPYLRIIGCALSILLGLVLFSADEATAAKPKAKKQKIPTAKPGSSAGEQSLTNIPLPVGHEAKGLTLPDFDSEGRLRGKFIATTARRVDQEHIQFQDLKITTFTPENQTDLQIDMQTSVFDLKTKILSSQQRATVKRVDFNIVGDSIQFDTNTRTGRMIGNVKMVITSQSQLMQQKKE
jgi:hypothetical protein